MKKAWFVLGGAAIIVAGWLGWEWYQWSQIQFDAQEDQL